MKYIQQYNNSTRKKFWNLWWKKITMKNQEHCKLPTQINYFFYPRYTCTPIASRNIAISTKYMMAWTRIATPLVCKLPNSQTLPLPGNWNRSPGERSINSNTLMNTGPQSDIFSLSNLCWYLFVLRIFLCVFVLWSVHI